jgi:hypothetical protein
VRDITWAIEKERHHVDANLRFRVTFTTTSKNDSALKWSVVQRLANDC